MADITILGSGGFGLSLAIMCEKMGHNVTVWSKFQDEIDTIKRTGELRSKLSGAVVPDGVRLTTDIACVEGANIVIIGIPTQFVAEVCNTAKPYMNERSVVVSTSKGFEGGTMRRMSEVIADILPNKTVVLSGPSHAEEIARGTPTTVVAACEDLNYAYYVQDELSNSTLRIYTNSDVIGCEVGGSLKNSIALAAGVVDGMGFGDNTKAALMTRGLTEIARIGVAMGADEKTFSGLTGLGDLIVTCTSMHSRNRRAGILIGQGVKAEEAVRRTGTVEGYYSTKIAYPLAKKLGVDAPIIEQLYKILFEDMPPKDALGHLMNRPMKHESEEGLYF